MEKADGEARSGDLVSMWYEIPDLAKLGRG